MFKVISLLTLPLRMFRGCLYTIREYILLEIAIQKETIDQDDEILEELDTAYWIKAFDDQKILSTTKNYLENCYELK